MSNPRYARFVAKKRSTPLVRISSTQRAMRVPRKKLTELIAFLASQEETAIAEVDLAIVASAEIASLNRRYLSQGAPTDVLSFDLSDRTTEGLFVQLVVCADAAVAHARAHGISAQRELMLYVVHGLLHQMDYEDKTPRRAARMHAREDEILDAFLAKSR